MGDVGWNHLQLPSANSKSFIRGPVMRVGIWERATPKTEEIQNIAQEIYDAGRRRGHEEASLGMPYLEESSYRGDLETSKPQARQRPVLFIVRG
jgi:hypothetical protein